MEYDDDVYERLLSNYELLCNIIRQAASGPQLKVDLSKIEGIIQKKIPDTLKKYAPEDSYELYTDFKSEYEKYSQLGKQIFKRNFGVFCCFISAIRMASWK